MNNSQCFKIVRDTKYDKAVKEHFSLLLKWDAVYKKVGELLDEKITLMVLDPKELIIDNDEIKKDENKKLFTTNGKLKQNTKRAKQLLQDYKVIIEDAGLTNFQTLSFINFIYGVMRTQGQHLESFKTSEDDIYYKADFDLEKKSKGLVEPISEIEYEEKYLEELKITKALNSK